MSAVAVAERASEWVRADKASIGDRVEVLGVSGVVITVRRHGRPECVYLGVRTDGGAEIVFELRTSERVQVVRS